jgi:DNA-binding transcriptional ArsR family regulator
MTTDTLDLQDMQAAAERACELMRVLANPDRLLICCQLSQQEMCVGDLEASLGIVQPTLSQQLTVLRNADLVATRREGKNIFYQLTSTSALAVMNTLYQQFCTTPTTRSKK